MRPIVDLLVALVRFLWPFANKRTQEVAGTVVVCLAALGYAAQALLPLDPIPAAPPAVEAPAPAVPPTPAAVAPPVVDPDATPDAPSGTGDDAAMGLEE